MAKKQNTPPFLINSISEMHDVFNMPKPKHPLVSVVNHNTTPMNTRKDIHNPIYNFYMICIKKNFDGTMKYGQTFYDFKEGAVSYISPGQVFGPNEVVNPKGWLFAFHADFLAGYPLSKTIKDYGFFSYETNEALHLSEQEEAVLENIMKSVETEYQINIDKFSQDVMVAQIELLLQYSNRFYNRQFITRKPTNDTILERLENVLSAYFSNENLAEKGLPTVQFVSEQLYVSPNYLSDMLRTITGQTTQQHIHSRLIDKAKELLTTTTLSVREIAFHLGFEYPQSFNKLFKNKTKNSPLEYRKSFN